MTELLDAYKSTIKKLERARRRLGETSGRRTGEVAMCRHYLSSGYRGAER